MTEISPSAWLGLDETPVLVAGAGGLGAACAAGFLDVGARVAVVDRDAERLKALADRLTDRPRTLEIITADLSQPGVSEEVVADVTQRLGGLEVLVHAIGINDRRPILDFDAADWQRIIDVNLTTAFTLIQAGGRHMVEQGRGRIVAISSVSALLAHANHGPYAASKGGMNQLLRVMAHEWAAAGVTVNALGPGYVETDLTAGYLSQGENRAKLERLVPAGRLGRPEEVVGAALFLASKHAAFITGQTVYIDGGRTLV